MTETWKHLDRLSKSLNVQVFASTHSEETIRAANQVLPQGTLSLHRLYRAAGQSRVVTYSGDEVGAALELNAEVR